ncbi:cleavage and polyadenylation specificity factor subunit 6 isoform X1 [Bactrocera neohumeralis]|uniref:cleavage and polyadenylation specificity factor subunit 6 isoform X1 n=1 Tax=Bactrocera tryoni TaxID=59916 RepID=UPI001A98678E|nr:cleavage and polyadenylation specificity factor subunit 6 isoform X1 [Bactrocera tryoni]XP_050336003.1 cleavage and polyadenylation specificity factor subunit 6 isoform X1 [Bactrocera neohumeralis]
MADGAVLDLYAEDLDKDFAAQNQEEFAAEGVDLYDDIGGPTEPSSVPAGVTVSANAVENAAPVVGGDSAANGSGSNGLYHQGGGSLTPNHMGRRYQLYVGNLTWWTTDQDIANVMREIGVTDFQEVKFFENRANGQSKGFSVISLGSEASLRLVLERLPKKELHGQAPVVTYPTKQALNQFESLQKTRPVPPSQQNGPPRGPAPPNMGVGGPMPPHPGGQGVPPGHPPRMINPNMAPGQYRPQHMQQGPPVGPNAGPPRMQQAPMHQGGGHMGPQQPLPGPPPRYPPNQGQWTATGQPRPNGPRVGPPNGPPQRPQMFQGPPGGMPIRGPRPDWNRPPMHGGFPQQGPPGGPSQGPPHMQGVPRGPPGGPPQMGPGGPPGGPHGGPGGPAPHVNPAFFAQPGGPPQHPGGPPMSGPPHGPPGPPPQGMGMPPQHGPPPHFAQQGTPRGPWPGPAPAKPQGQFPDQAIGPQLSEVEFEEIMSRNRTVSSSAIARAVSDAAAGEYSSAIETLVTAISLIKQSKVAHDERCKILISSLQDTLHGIETKSYNRRERSRSRERTHRPRQRRERSSSRYRERSRERERERDRDREAGYRERSRSRERERPVPDHYRDDSSSSRSARPRKSPEAIAEVVSDVPSKRSYYEERYRSSDRDRDRDRERERERDRDRDRERDRDRREEHRSRH